MAASTSLDTFLPLLTEKDPKRQLQISADLLNYLNIEDNSIECENITAFIDSIILNWVNSNNPKVVQNGLEILSHLSIRMKEDLKSYLSTILASTIDRLGDVKVKEQAKNLLIKLMNFVSTPQLILEKLMPAFQHKNHKVREEICLFFKECLLLYGVNGSTNGQLFVSKFIQPLIILISDPNAQVRDQSLTTLLEIYKHVGNKLRNEILKKYSTQMPQQKLQTLLSKFDEIDNLNNNFNNNSPNNNNNGVGDEVDFKKTTTMNSFKRATSAPPVKRILIPSKLPPSSSINKSSTTSTSSSTGAADEEMFMNAFEDVPRIQIFSLKDLEKELNLIRETCSNSNAEWEKRIDCLKRFRSLLIAGAHEYDEFFLYLKPLEVSFQTSVKDLRSQVVREACISIAYLSQRIGNKCDKFAAALLPTLIDSIQNSAKIMSSSAMVAIRFIIQYTHTGRLIPIITYNISSKSKEIRKACCEFLDQLLHTWPTHILEKHVGALQEAIKKGISDANPEARALARKAFWGFADKFKAESDYLLNSLDSNKQRMLQGEQMSNWSSTNSLNKVSTYSTSKPLNSRNNSISTNGSMESINRHCNNATAAVMLNKRSAIPVTTQSPRINSSSRTPQKATSAIDIDAQKRARAKAHSYLNQQQQQQPKPFLNSVYSLSNSKKNDTPIIDRNTAARMASSSSVMSSASKKNSRVSKSQPGSRSASPSSRINYTGAGMGGTTNSCIGGSSYKTPPKRLTSRDQSPARTTTSSRYERKLSSSSSITTSRSKSYMNNSDLDLHNNHNNQNNRILQQNDERIFEHAFRNITPRSKKCFDDQSDESETSSICSDASFAIANYVRKSEDINKILENLSSSHWSDKKDGLLGLNNFLRYSDERLNQFQLKRITDIFTRMLVDPHTKAFSLFLNTLNELIHIYKNDLNSWLYILMTRLFLKIGSDTLGSIQTRILKTFELIRESFPIDDQFNVIMRLLSDQTQTMNSKIKIAVLQYLSKLIFLMDSSDFTANRSNNEEIRTALVKIISWTADIKSSDLRKISQDTIVDLYNLNSTEMTIYLNSLLKNYQEAALQIIQHKQKTSPISPSVMQTPYLVKKMAANQNFFDLNEHLNPADIYDSLKKTSDEIQKYSFSLDHDSVLSPIPINTNNSNGDDNNNNNHNNVVDNRNNNNKIDTISSLDSGMIHHDLNHSIVGAHNRKFSNNILNNHYGSSSISSSSNINGYNNSMIQSPSATANQNGFTNENQLLTSFNSLSLIDDETLQQNLLDLIQFVNDSTTDEISKKCKIIYKSLLQKLKQTNEELNPKMKILILRCLGQLLYKANKSSFEEFAEETFLLLMDLVCKDDDKEVVKNSEDTAIYAVYHFDSAIVFKILKPFMNHEQYCYSIISIKLLTKMIELNSKEIVTELLPELMPPLLQAYDNKESAVRKNAVFCMVAIYVCVGDTMNCYLTSLNRTKMKLLKLYIDRTVQQQQQQTTNNN